MPDAIKEKIKDFGEKYKLVPELNEEKRKLIFFFIKAAAVLYAFLIIHIIHIMHVRQEKPYLTLDDLIRQGFIDIFIHPLRIFPIPPGTLGTLIGVTAVVILTGLLILQSARIRASKQPASAKWMTALDRYNEKFTEPFGKRTHEGTNNMIFSQDVYMSMNNQKIRRNMNVFVIGGSGAGKSFNFVGPNIMQKNCSYIITDPSGGLYREYGSFLEYMGYEIKCFNLTHMEKGNHYNPFNYIHGDKDIEILVTTLISNTTPPDKQGGDPFWEKSETALLIALIAYLYHYTAKDCQNFSGVMRLMRAANIDENDSSAKSPLDYIFEEVEKYDPESFAVKQYKTFKMGAGKTLKGILISCAVRLQAFDLQDVATLTDTDDIDLDSVGDKKTALFIIVPTGEKTFNFLAAMMYSQLFQRTYDYCENTAEFSQLVLDGDRQIIRTYRASSPDDAIIKRAEAEAFLERAKQGRVQYNDSLKWYEIVTPEGEMVTYRGSQEEADKELEFIRAGEVIGNNKQSNHGQRLPVHTRLLLDEFANIGKIPEFDQKVATIRKYEISVSIILQSLAQMQKMYKDDWSDIAGNCDTTIYLGGGADTVTAEWVSKLLGKETRVISGTSLGKSGSTSLNRQAIELYSPAELRTMPEDECIVIMKSMDAYKGKKYRALDHPQRALVESLDPYYFNEEKKNKILQAHKPLMEEEREEDLPEEAHGGDPVQNEPEKEVFAEENEEKKQAAAEINNNKDAEGRPVISEPEPVNEQDHKFVEAVSVKDSSGKTQVQEREKSMSTSDEAWGLDELEFGMASMDDSPY